MKRTQVVAGIIRNLSGEVLLAQRPPHKYLAGLWEFPGGKIEAGETAELAIVRELKEELELDVRVETQLGCFPFDYPDHSIDLHVICVSALNTPVATEEVQVFRWVKATEIDPESLAPADIAPLATLLRFLDRS